MRYVFRNRKYIFLIGIIDLAGRIFCFFLPKKKNIENINNILLIRLDHLGDVIHSLFIPQILKKYYPNAKITFLISQSAYDIVVANPFVDNVICYDVPWFSRSSRKKSTLSAISGLVKKLSGAKFDVGFDLRGDFRHVLIMFLSGVKFKVGYGITGGDFLLQLCPEYKEWLMEKDKDIKLVEDFLKKNLDKEISLAAEKKDYYEYLPSTSKDELRRKFNLELDRRYILMHPLAGISSKIWSKENWNNLIRFLSEKFSNIGIIIVGRNSNITLQFEGGNVVDLLNKTTFCDLIGLCKLASLTVSCDSGPAHISYILGKPLIVIASGINVIDNWFKENENTIVIQKKTGCYNCQAEKCPRERHECMEAISAEYVMDEICKLIN